MPVGSGTQLLACGVIEIPCGLLQVLHTVLRPMPEHVLYGVAARERILAGEVEAFEWRVRVMAGIADWIVLDHDFPFTGVPAGPCLADTTIISHYCDIPDYSFVVSMKSRRACWYDGSRLPSRPSMSSHHHQRRPSSSVLRLSQPVCLVFQGVPGSVGLVFSMISVRSWVQFQSHQTVPSSVWQG